MNRSIHIEVTEGISFLGKRLFGMKVLRSDALFFVSRSFVSIFYGVINFEKVAVLPFVKE